MNYKRTKPNNCNTAMAQLSPLNIRIFNIECRRKTIEQQESIILEMFDFLNGRGKARAIELIFDMLAINKYTKPLTAKGQERAAFKRISQINRCKAEKVRANAAYYGLVVEKK